MISFGSNVEKVIVFYRNAYLNMLSNTCTVYFNTHKLKFLKERRFYLHLDLQQVSPEARETRENEKSNIVEVSR